MAIKVEMTNDDCALIFRGETKAMEMIVPPHLGRDKAPAAFVALCALLEAAGVLDGVMEVAQRQMQAGLPHSAAKKDGDTFTIADHKAAVAAADGLMDEASGPRTIN